MLLEELLTADGESRHQRGTHTGVLHQSGAFVFQIVEVKVTVVVGVVGGV